MSEWVPIPDAAERLGVSADTIRRRLKRGELTGRKEPRAQGHVWLIEVDADRANSEREPSGQRPASGWEEAFELVQLRERVSALERERVDLIAQRDAWQEQARRSGEAEQQLRELVAHAQMFAQSLPAGVGADNMSEARTQQSHGAPSA
jgi:transposase